MSTALILSLAASISLLKGDPVLRRVSMQRQGFHCLPLLLPLQM